MSDFPLSRNSDPFAADGGTARLPSRAEIRDVVMRNGAEIREIAKAGGELHRAAQDQGDKVLAYASLLAPADALTFVRVFTEETNASTARDNMELAVLRAKHAQGDSRMYATIAIVIVTLAALYFIARVLLL